MKNILVLTDFSPSAYNAAKFAVNLAGTFADTHIIVYNSFAFVTINPENVGQSVVDFQTFLQLSESEMAKMSDLLKPLIKSDTTIEYKVDQRPLVFAAEEICANDSIDLIVAGGQVDTDAVSMIFGGSVKALINSLATPLLIVPGNSDFEKFDKAVLACDLKNVEGIPVETLRSVVSDLKIKLDVLNIDTHHQDKFSVDTISNQKKLHKLLGNIAVEYHYTNHPSISEGIQQFAKSNEMDLVIVIHKENGFFYRLTHRSTSNKLAIITTIPLLILREQILE